MQINTRFFPTIISDNEEAYFQHLFGLIESVDELCSLEITCLHNAYSFRIAPSLPKYNDMLLKEILKYHNMLHIQLDISKSIKSSATLNFNIYL